jgi:hypothetical protein
MAEHTLLHWIAGGVAMMAAIAVTTWRDVRRQREYDQTHPPISDEGFVRLCSPGTDPRIANGFPWSRLCSRRALVFPENLPKSREPPPSKLR